MPSGHAFQIVEIHEDLQDVEDLPDGFPIDLDLHGPDGRGNAAEDALLDVLAELPARPPEERSGWHVRRRRRPQTVI